jgi:hypothetical protein
MRFFLLQVICLLTTQLLFAQQPFLKGRYLTVEQLLSDSVQPNSAADVYVKSEGIYTQYIIYDSITGKKIKPVFAYYDGSDLYLNQSLYGIGKFYVKAIEKGRFYYFEDMYYSSNYARAAGSAALFGLIGVAIVYYASPSGNKTVPKIDFTDVPSEKLCGIVLDTYTGNIIGLSAKNIERVFATEPEVIDYFTSSRKKIEDIRKCVQLLNLKYAESK